MLPSTSTAPPSVRVRAGDLVAGKYEVERVLAAGGMGVVVAAHHRQLLRRVALKFLLGDLCERPEIVARFLREAQAMTTIQNEHVARVLDVGTTDDGAPYMVMEYLEGEDLGQTLERRGRLPVAEAVEYLLQAMEALAEAHVHGFVHRDLKPSNLFVTKRPDGSPLVKVLDFGISKAISDEAPVNLTQTNGLLGSPLYMSPEQIRSSRTVDTRADIWTLGVILHELVAGRPPFDGDSVPAVLASIVSDDPIALHLHAADAPEELSAVVLRCMKRKREERYPTVAELASDLRPFANAEGRHSIDRIERVVAHQRRASTPVDLQVRTPPRTPVVAPAASTVAAPVTAPAGTTPAPVSPKAATAGGASAFGKYRLLAILGHGGMADVFLAVLGGPEGLGFHKLVVLKRLRPNLAGDPEFVAMLVDEARIAAKLSHPNVIQTHEVGVINNEYYIAMEYLDGQALHRILQRTNAMPLAFRLGIVRDLLAGLHHAHELVDYDGSPVNVVHRDVTPQNLFVTYEGQVKVVDFGIAKAKGRATETQQGVVKGKIGYMAPEQAGGQDVDRRADVFSAGVILWELLAGERLWKGEGDVAIMQKLLLDKIPSSPRAVNGEVPKALDAIVKKALSKKREQRFASAQEFQLEIERFMESEGLKCTARDLGAWTSELFDDRRKRTRSLIEAQLSAARTPDSLHVMQLLEPRTGTTPSSSSERGGGGGKLERLDQEPVTDENISGRDAVMARSHPGMTPLPPRLTRSKTPFVILGTAIVLATAVLLMIRAQKPKPIASPAPSDTVAPVVVVSTPPPSPPTPQDIHVILVSPIAAAEFAIDDEPKARGPLTLTRPKDGKAHRITVSAPGFRPDTKTFTFDADVTWTASPLPMGSKPGPVASHAPATSATVTAAATATAAPIATASGRKKRELDNESPYAGGGDKPN